MTDLTPKNLRTMADNPFEFTDSLSRLASHLANFNESLDLDSSNLKDLSDNPYDNTKDLSKLAYRLADFLEDFYLGRTDSEKLNQLK